MLPKQERAKLLQVTRAELTKQIPSLSQSQNEQIISSLKENEKELKQLYDLKSQCLNNATFFVTKIDVGNVIEKIAKNVSTKDDLLNEY